MEFLGKDGYSPGVLALEMSVKMFGDLVCDVDAVLAATEPHPSVMEQFNEKVLGVLATGMPVTVIYDGKPVTTYFPDGTSQRHRD